MLSILISSYDYDCRELVQSLRKQAELLRRNEDGFRYEICVSDDCPNAHKHREENEEINSYGNCRFLVQKTNLGIAQNKNFLIGTAKYDYIIILDCDARLCSNHYLANYWNSRHLGDVLCGRLVNPPLKCGHELRHKYEQNAIKHRSLSTRQKHPYAMFSVFNVFGKKSVFENIGFDSRCTEYGYEDTLIGLKMQERGIRVVHIENPVVHLGIDSNESFLNKTEAALRVLSRLDGKIRETAGASKIERKLSKIGLSRVAAMVFNLLRRPMRRNLLGHNPSLLVFKFYKLGYFCSICAKGESLQGS